MIIKKLCFKMYILLFVLTISICNPLIADENAGAFLTAVQYPRASGLGQAFSAVANDATAMIYNPAGLSLSAPLQIATMYYYGYETAFYSAFLTGRYGFLGVGIGYAGASMGNIPRSGLSTIPGRYEFTGESFGYNADTLFTSLALNLNELFAMGITGKLFRETLDSNRMIGMNADIGIMAKPYDFLTISAVAQNCLPTTLKWNNGYNQDKLPLQIKGGTAVNLLDKKLLISTEIAYQDNRPISFYGGTEYWLTPFLPIRLGYHDRLYTGLGLYCYPVIFNIVYMFQNDAVVNENLFQFGLELIFPENISSEVLPSQPVPLTSTINKAPVKVTNSVVKKVEPLPVIIPAENLTVTESTDVTSNETVSKKESVAENQVIQLSVNQRYQIIDKRLPNSLKDIIFWTSDPSVITVSGKGEVLALSKGNSLIKVFSVNTGNEIMTFVFKVY